MHFRLLACILFLLCPPSLLAYQYNVSVHEDIDAIEYRLNHNDLSYKGIDKEIDGLEQIKITLTQCPNLMSEKIKSNEHLISSIEHNPQKNQFQNDYETLSNENQQLENIKLDCELTLYHVNNMITEAKIKQDAIKPSIKIHDNFYQAAVKIQNSDKKIEIKPYANVINLNFLNISQLYILEFVSLLAIILSFTVRHFISRLNKSKYDLVLKGFLEISQNYIVILIPLLIFNFTLDSMTSNLKSPGAIANFTKVLFEFSLLHYLFKCYLFLALKVKDKVWEQQIWKVFNICLSILFINSCFNWFQKNFLLPSVSTELLIKFYILLGSTLLIWGWFWFIKVCTDLKYFDASSKTKVHRYRYTLLGFILIFYSIRVILAFIFGLDEISLGSSRKFLLVIMVCFFTHLLFKYIKFVIDSLKYQNFKFGGITIQRWLGLSKDNTLWQLSLLKLTFFTYFILAIFIPLCINFTELPASFAAIYHDFIYEGFNIATYLITPITLIYGLFFYCLFILFGQYFIGLILRLPGINEDINKMNTLSMVLGYINQIFAILCALKISGFNLQNLVVILGGLSVGVGIGLNVFFSDMICGVLIMIKKTIRVNDYITLRNENVTGYVKKIHLLSTQLMTEDHKILNFSNTTIFKSAIANHTLENQTPFTYLTIDLKNISDRTQAQDLIRHYLNHNRLIVHHGLLAPDLSFNVIQGNNNVKKNLITFSFNLKDVENKSVLVTKIDEDIHELLQKNNIELVERQEEQNIEASTRGGRGGR